KAGKLKDAYESQQRALVIRKRLADASPKVAEYQQFLASSIAGLGILEQREGRAADAVVSFRTAIATLERLQTPTPPQQYNLACYYALLAGVALEAGSGISAGEAKPIADKAMDTLRRAVTAGYRNVAHMKVDTDLDTLRCRDDFKKLKAELEKQSTPP